MTTEQIETDLEIIAEIPEELGQGEIQFTPTGIRHKDMAIAGMINDAPNACKALFKEKMWDTVCASANPAGAAELALLRTFKLPENKLRLILIKLKTQLAGLDMSVPQAFHNCILEDQIKRINIDKIKVLDVRTDVPNSPVEIATKKEQTEDTACPQLNGSILTHIDGSTYTFGTRGRRPLWVKEWLTTHDEP